MRAPILVPLDGSPFGEQAIPTALGLAKGAGVPVELVLVQEPIAIPDSIRSTLLRDSEVHAEMHLAGTKYLQMIGARLREHTDVRVSERLLEGAVLEALAARIAAEPPRMVVMSTHGRGGISRAWLGSVADALVRRVSVPVMLVRPREGLVQRAGAVPMLASPPFTRIMVPLDGTPLAEEALVEALRISGESGVELTLLQVLPPPVTYLRPTFTADIASELLADLETEAERYLERVARGVARRGLTVRTRVLIDSNVARGILSFAASGALDLIVMTTHARRGLARLVVGSVADKVVRAAAVPVVLVRPSHLAEVDEVAAGTSQHASLVGMLPPF